MWISTQATVESNRDLLECDNWIIWRGVSQQHQYFATLFFSCTVTIRFTFPTSKYLETWNYLPYSIRRTEVCSRDTGSDMPHLLPNCHKEAQTLCQCSSAWFQWLLVTLNWKIKLNLWPRQETDKKHVLVYSQRCLSFVTRVQIEILL
jgi:hypothetical protein